MHVEAQQQQSRLADPAWSLLVQGAAMAMAAYSYATLPDKLVAVHSNTFTAAHWVAPALWGVFFVSILAALPPAWFSPVIDTLAGKRDWRMASTALVWLFGLAQLWVIGLLVHFILHNQVANDGTQLVHIAARIEGTTIVIAAFSFWLLDSGGPIERQQALRAHPDFLWPQNENPSFAPADWRPSFVDYLYVSFTNATAFSPTDVMPLTSRVKLVMLIEAGASAVTVLLVAARAVNILNG